MHIKGKKSKVTTGMLILVVLNKYPLLFVVQDKDTLLFVLNVTICGKRQVSVTGTICYIGPVYVTMGTSICYYLLYQDKCPLLFVVQDEYGMEQPDPVPGSALSSQQQSPARHCCPQEGTQTDKIKSNYFCIANNWFRFRIPDPQPC